MDENSGTTAVGHMDSPVGPLTVVASGTGLRQILFGALDAQTLTDRLHGDVREDPRHLDPILRELGEYFAGTRRTFDVALDLHTDTPFLADVLTAMQHIPYGQRWSYVELAREAGHPGAVRATGSACRRNPLPLVIPCHRVVRSDGSIGNYAGGTEAKRWLLDLEAPRG